jgi:hypothetical protein
MATIERRYEAAVAVVDELRHFCVRLALAVAACGGLRAREFQTG